jgi:hypothetical protein
MAAGDVTVFNVHLQDIGRGVHNLETGDISLGLITNAVTPASTTAAPCWGAGGTTNFDTNEVTAGGNYINDGPSIGGTYAQAAGTATFDVTDVDIEQNAANPTDARWGIIYNETATNNECIAFIDLGAVINLTAGDFSITWHANGVYTIS